MVFDKPFEMQLLAQNVDVRFYDHDCEKVKHCLDVYSFPYVRSRYSGHAFVLLEVRPGVIYPLPVRIGNNPNEWVALVEVI